jgi:threonylcarbamoyladenosine tRNA methylthiotransferase MtaB
MEKDTANQSSIEMLTFGCRLNTYESEVMRDHASKAGLDNVVIVNSCAVTKEAERQVRQSIRKARRNNPDAKIIVTGCAAQIDPDGYAAMPEIDSIVGNDLKLGSEVWQDLSTNLSHSNNSKKEGYTNLTHKYGDERILVNDIMSVTETASHLVESFEGRSRAFLQVQNGCDHRCTFCIIPYGRGNSRSVPIGEIVNQTRHLVENGYKEIVLTGVDVTSYGPDLPGQPTFGQMIRRVLSQVPELPRLRLSSLDPVEIDDDLWRLIAEEPRFMPYLHLSLQAGDDMILKRMKRRHLRQDVIDVCKRARDYRPDMTFGADIIAGFPTETDEMFENSVNIIEECDISFSHIFPYSPREGTPAAKMPQIDPQIRKKRAAILREKADVQLLNKLKSNINKNIQVIVEKNNFARSESFLPVRVQGDFEEGALINVKSFDIDEAGSTLLVKAI